MVASGCGGLKTEPDCMEGASLSLFVAKIQFFHTF
jgi:hypothetical protein